jgi:putative transcriptional regulator
MGKSVEGPLESVQQRDEIHRGEPQPSRAFSLDALQAREIRKATGPIQAKALLRAKHVIQTLSA